MHPNEQVVRSFYEAFEKEDAAGIQALVDPNIVWHEVGRNPFSREYEGLEEVVGFFERMGNLLEGSEVRIHDVIANDTHVVVLESMNLVRGETSLATRAAAIFHVSDGKITEGWEFREDQYGMDELLRAATSN